MTDLETEVITNGKVDTELSANERKWLSALLSIPEVCAVLTSGRDKAFAATIQAKLEPQGP